MILLRLCVYLTALLAHGHGSLAQYQQDYIYVASLGAMF